MVLDELDHLETGDQEVLFKIFQWAFVKNSNLILVGIANALDLTDRFLPRLRGNNLKPQELAFAPYTAEQITQIITYRLRSLAGTENDPSAPVPLIHPAAIQLCAKKTAANTGDLRKALDICRRAVEVVEEEVRSRDTSDDAAAAGDRKHALLAGQSGALSSLSLCDAPRASVAQVARICAQAFGGTTVQRIQKLNLQQKAILCVLVAGERALAASANAGTGSGARMTLRRLFDEYGDACERERMLASLQLNEFLEVIGALESAGVVNVTGVCGRKGLGSTRDNNRVPRGSRAGGTGYFNEFEQRKISSNVHLMDLVTAVSSVGVLAQFLP